MYKRTEQAIINNAPPKCTCMCKAQFGKAMYKIETAFAITTRIDASNAFCLIEYNDIKNMDNNLKINQTGNIIPNTKTNKDIEDAYRIRKLTPRECFRLMGVDELNIDKIQSAGISRTQQYKMAGNSIVVDVLYHIFRKMFIDTECEDGQLMLF